MKYIPSLELADATLENDAGVGQDSQIIRRYTEDLLADYFKPFSRQWANPIIRFSNLKDDWQESTSMLSSITEIAMHPSYQQIIGMGPTALPIIFLSMRQEPDHWFWALRAITGENPIPINHQGKIKEMTDAWMEWGKKHLYLE